MPTRIAIIAGRDWHFAARAMPLVRAARELGMDAYVLTGGREQGDVVEDLGARLVPVGAKLHSLNPMIAGYAAGQVGAALKSVRPDLVHCIGLEPSLIGGAACVMAGVERRIYALGPLGGLALPDDRVAWLGRRVLSSLVKGPLRSASTRFVFETEADPPLFGLERAPEVAIIPGVGVDPERLRPLPMPQSPPLKIAIVAPMVWTEGIDVAVEAVRRARERGTELELSLYGSQDGSRLRRYGRRRLADWAAQPGIMLRSEEASATALWQDHHVACVPSRASGIPLSLLEAAACGRALVATDVPGCREIVTDGSEGLLVPPDDPDALAAAFVRLAADPVLPPRMGAAARARVLQGYHVRDLIEATKRLYAGLLDGAHRA